MKCHQGWSKAKIMLEGFFSSHSISKEIQSQRIYNEQDKICQRATLFMRSNLLATTKPQGLWIPRYYSTIIFWCIAPPSLSKNWWNTAKVCYHTHHILKTWAHATPLFAGQENTVWWPLWQCTECQGCFNKGSLLDRRRSIPELLPRPLHLLPEMH